MPDFSQNLATFDSVAERFCELRNKSLFERGWLDRLCNQEEVKTLLDVGCGPGLPVARYLAERGIAVTGVDGSQAMVDLFKKNLPDAEAIVADMRGLELGREFDAVLAFDCFFFLTRDEQRQVLPRLAAHVREGGLLMLNTGHEDAEGDGWAIPGAPVAQASLAPEEYRRIFAASGMTVLEFSPQDPETGRTMWLARRED